MIKLLKIETLDNGVVRLQSQLCVGSSIADHIIQDGQLHEWKKGNFCKTDEPYQIVDTPEQMQYQAL